MDFRNFNNPTTGNSPNIDTKVKAFSGLDGDITHYLSDPDKLGEFAIAADKAHEMGEFTAPFLDNVTKYLEGLTKVVDGQTAFTQLRKKFGSKVTDAKLARRLCGGRKTPTTRPRIYHRCGIN